MSAIETTIRRAKPGTVGGAGVIEAAREYVVDVGTVAGLWPFELRTNPSQHGTPLGIDPNSGQLAGYDPHTSFVDGQQRAAQLAILAANGTGKSVLAKKLATGFAGRGISTIVPFDAKDEYGPLIDALGGTALTVGRTGGLNALDPGETIATATEAGAPTPVLAELRARRNQLVATIAGISRGAALTGWEQTALTAVLNKLPPGAVLGDLADAFQSGQDMLATVIGRDPERADQLLEPLTLDIAALAQGNIGQALGTTSPDQAWPIHRPLVIDTSAVLATEPELTAAVTVTCWTAALSAIHYTNAVDPAGGRVFAVIFDEIWRATREFPALANQIGGLLRMDRNDGIITIIATHSWTDTANPGGSNILARCAAFAIGGLQNEEVDTIATAGIGLNPAELDEIRANSTAGTTSGGTAHGGTGRFLIKTGDQPGQLIQTILTPTEQRLYDTNHKWTTTNTAPNHGPGHTLEPENHDGADEPDDATDHQDANNADPVGPDLHTTDPIDAAGLGHHDARVEPPRGRRDETSTAAIGPVERPQHTAEQAQEDEDSVQASSWPDGAPITRAGQLPPVPVGIDLSIYAYQPNDPRTDQPAPVELAVLDRLDIDDPTETVALDGDGWHENLDQGDLEGEPLQPLGSPVAVSCSPVERTRPDVGASVGEVAVALAAEPGDVVATLTPPAEIDADRAWEHWEQVSHQVLNDDDFDPRGVVQLHPMIGATRFLFRAGVGIYVVAGFLYTSWVIAALVAAVLLTVVVPTGERWITAIMTDPSVPDQA